jgi:5-methylcytosine-specific restriction endonuclease McrA
MKCKVEGCSKDAQYKEKQLCQMHYFRIMRNGTTDTLPKSRKYRLQNPAGYQKIFEPNHPTVNSDGYAYEHRFVVYEEYGENLPNCAICGKVTDWETCHIDHIDRDVTNNKLDNLRPLCRGCNTFRDYPDQHTLNGHHAVTCNGKTMTPTEWARQPGVNVSHSTIVHRLAKGMSAQDAIFSEKKTHNGKGKTDNRPRKTARRKKS